MLKSFQCLDREGDPARGSFCFADINSHQGLRAALAFFADGWNCQAGTNFNRNHISPRDSLAPSRVSKTLLLSPSPQAVVVTKHHDVWSRDIAAAMTTWQVGSAADRGVVDL